MGDCIQHSAHTHKGRRCQLTGSTRQRLALDALPHMPFLLLALAPTPSRPPATPATNRQHWQQARAARHARAGRRGQEPEASHHEHHSSSITSSASGTTLEPCRAPAYNSDILGYRSASALSLGDTPPSTRECLLCGELPPPRDAPDLAGDDEAAAAASRAGGRGIEMGGGTGTVRLRGLSSAALSFCAVHISL